jgi:hypothetical protein
MVLDALGSIVTRSESERIGGIENLGDRTLGGECNTILQDLISSRFRGPRVQDSGVESKAASQLLCILSVQAMASHCGDGLSPYFNIFNLILYQQDKTPPVTSEMNFKSHSQLVDFELSRFEPGGFSNVSFLA